jgi:hypothetical protein
VYEKSWSSVNYEWITTNMSQVAVKERWPLCTVYNVRVCTVCVCRPLCTVYNVRVCTNVKGPVVKEIKCV